jgi:uncharacterized phage protein (TIGR02216 family)
MGNDRTPWAAWLRAGMAFGVPPHRFWAMSLKEWRALSGGGPAAGLPRSELEGLMSRFPDEIHDR